MWGEGEGGGDVLLFETAGVRWTEPAATVFMRNAKA